MLDSLWVWHGRGSTDAERAAALAYSKSLIAGTEKSVQEVEEGNEDEMFWMFLGEDDYARADYWRWKKDIPSSPTQFPHSRIWQIVATESKEQVRIYRSLFEDTEAHFFYQVKELNSFPDSSTASSAILVLYLTFEIFILIGAQARGRRREIRIALEFAKVPFSTPLIRNHIC